MKTYTTQEAGYLLGVNAQTINRWIKSGKLKATWSANDIGYGYYQISEKDLEASICNHTQQALAMVDTYSQRKERQRQLDYLDARESELYDELCIIQEMKRQISRWDL